MSEQTLKLIKENDVKWVDLRFTDTKGKEQHLTIPSSEVGVDFFEDGKMFDGSSIAGWKAINASDMLLMPDDKQLGARPLLRGVGRDPALHRTRARHQAGLQP